MNNLIQIAIIQFILLIMLLLNNSLYVVTYKKGQRTFK